MGNCITSLIILTRDVFHYLFNCFHSFILRIVSLRYRQNDDEILFVGCEQQHNLRNGVETALATPSEALSSCAENDNDTDEKFVTGNIKDNVSVKIKSAENICNDVENADANIKTVVAETDTSNTQEENVNSSRQDIENGDKNLKDNDSSAKFVKFQIIDETTQTPHKRPKAIERDSKDGNSRISLADTTEINSNYEGDINLDQPADDIKSKDLLQKEDKVKVSSINAEIVAKIIARIRAGMKEKADACPEQNLNISSKAKFRKFGVSYGSSERSDGVQNLQLEEINHSTSSDQCSPPNSQVLRVDADNGCSPNVYSRLTLNNRKLSTNTIHTETIDNCHKHKIKRLSLPDMSSGCIYVTSNDNDNLKLPKQIPEALNVDNQSFQIVLNEKLLCGGISVSGELSSRIILPNFYAEEDPIIINQEPQNVVLPEIFFTANNKDFESGRMYSRSLSGGSLVEEDIGRRVSLPDVFTTIPSQEESRSPSVKSLSGGGLLDFSDTDHIIYSDILSGTVICSQKSVFEDAFVSITDTKAN